MKKILFFLLLVFVTSAGIAQTTTTFILVRHAEKGTDDPRDPDLSDAGKQRAQVLANLLKETKVDDSLRRNAFPDLSIPRVAMVISLAND